jgi:hypothetical protein
MSSPIRSPRRRGRHGDTGQPRGLGVDHQLELYSVYDWRVRGLHALKDATGIDAHLMIRVHGISSAIHHICSLT